MVTVTLVFVVLIFLFCLVDKGVGSNGLFILLGGFVSIVLAIVAAVLIGSSYPTKSTTILRQEIVTSNISTDDMPFYLQEGNTFSFQVDGKTKTFSSNNAIIVFDDTDMPYFEFQKVELALPKGQGWKWLFGITNLPLEVVVIHVPKNSGYIMTK